MLHTSIKTENNGNTGGIILPENRDSSRLQELALMNNT